MEEIYNMRRVTFHRMVDRGKENHPKFVMGNEVRGWFHEFGMDCEEFGNMTASFSTAIIELDDGSIANIPVENMEFVVPYFTELNQARNKAGIPMTLENFQKEGKE